MAGAADSDDYVHSTTFLNPGDDLELERTNNFFAYVSDNTSTAQPGYPSIDYVPELNCFEDNLAPQLILSQYNYPQPTTDHEYRPLPYPKPSVPTSEQVAAHYTSSDDRVKRAWAQRCSYTNSLTVTPNQTVLADVGQHNALHTRARDAPALRTLTDRSTLSSVQPHTPQSLISHHNPVYIQRLAEPGITTSVDSVFHDSSTPYVPGAIIRGNDHLQELTDVLTAVAERPTFACNDCNKNCKTRSALTHHKITHNKTKAHQHKCPKCDSGFRYPKDLKRHDKTRHGDTRYPCADCHKTYGRKDHLARHTLRSGHVALSESPSLLLSPLSAPADRPVTTEAHQNGYPQPYYHSYGHDLSQKLHGIVSSPSPSNMPGMYSYPALLEVPRSIPSFGFAGSLDGTGTGSFTTSEVDSFTSETFYFE